MGTSAPKVPPARRAALHCIELTEKGPDLQLALDQTLKAHPMARNDAALATELCYGYFRFKGRLEFLVSRFMHRKNAPSSSAMTVLCLAAYELLYLSRVPAYATVHWAVEEMRHRFGEGLARMANAVLRRVDEVKAEVDRFDIYQEDNPPDDLFLSRFLSCPLWVIQVWLRHFGRDAALTLGRAGLTEAPLGLRFNAKKREAAALNRSLAEEGHAIAAVSFGLALKSTPAGLDEWIKDGLVSRQSLAAQEAMLALHPETWPEPVLDACAGRGGKTFQLAERGITVLASDVHMVRLSGIKGEIKRLAINIPAFLASASSPLPLRQPPGTIFLDVPCSGLGVLSRRPDSKWKRTTRDVSAVVQLQRRMLENSRSEIRPGGRMVYMTCTVNPEENETQIARFLKDHPDIQLLETFQTPFDSPLKEFFYGALLEKQ